jgi:hypothetical protein
MFMMGDHDVDHCNPRHKNERNTNAEFVAVVVAKNLETLAWFFSQRLLVLSFFFSSAKISKTKTKKGIVCHGRKKIQARLRNLSGLKHQHTQAFASREIFLLEC